MDAIFPSDYKPEPISVSSLQGMLVNKLHNAGKNRGIDEKLVEEVEHHISLAVKNFTDTVIIPMRERGDFVDNDLFEYYGIYREGVTIRRQMAFPNATVKMENFQINEWIRLMKLPVSEIFTQWSVSDLNVIYANLGLYYQRRAMQNRYNSFYRSSNPLDWIDIMTAQKKSNVKDPSHDPPQEWVEISNKWSYMMFKKV